MEGMEEGVGCGYTSSLFSSPELASKRFDTDSGTNGRKEGVADGYFFSGVCLQSFLFKKISAIRADSGTQGRMAGRRESVAGGYIFNGRVYGASWNNSLVTATGNSLLRRVLSDRWACTYFPVYMLDATATTCTTSELVICQIINRSFVKAVYPQILFGRRVMRQANNYDGYIRRYAMLSEFCASTRKLLHTDTQTNQQWQNHSLVAFRHDFSDVNNRFRLTYWILGEMPDWISAPCQQHCKLTRHQFLGERTEKKNDALKMRWLTQRKEKWHIEDAVINPKEMKRKMTHGRCGD